MCVCRYNEVHSRWVAKETWTFSTTFATSDPSTAAVFASSAVQLRFDGLDTFATVQLNGKTILTANNFHRWDCLSLGSTAQHAAAVALLKANSRQLRP